MTVVLLVIWVRGRYVPGRDVRHSDMYAVSKSLPTIHTTTQASMMGGG